MTSEHILETHLYQSRQPCRNINIICMDGNKARNLLQLKLYCQIETRQSPWMPWSLASSTSSQRWKIIPMFQYLLKAHFDKVDCFLSWHQFFESSNTSGPRLSPAFTNHCPLTTLTNPCVSDVTKGIKKVINKGWHKTENKGLFGRMHAQLHSDNRRQFEDTQAPAAAGVQLAICWIF